MKSDPSVREHARRATRVHVHARGTAPGQSVGKVSEPEARAAYIAMGHGRSVRKLHQRLIGTGSVISLSSLQARSSKFGWPALAAYVAMGPERSHVKLRRQCGEAAVSRRTLESCAKRHGWPERSIRKLRQSLGDTGAPPSRTTIEKLHRRCIAALVGEQHRHPRERVTGGRLEGDQLDQNLIGRGSAARCCAGATKLGSTRALMVPRRCRGDASSTHWHRHGTEVSPDLARDIAPNLHRGFTGSSGERG